MKKYCAIASLAAVFVACNNSGKGKEGGDTTKPADTVVTPPADTTATPPADTTANADTTAAKM
ncbi:MAG: hypothetical protein HOP10_12425 [Chitinophagaceae bacterium]|nr:hypothetical protein [Chitinophagaceae bacterium]